MPPSTLPCSTANALAARDKASTALGSSLEAGTSLGAGVTACVSLLSAGGGAAASSAAAAVGLKYASVRASVGAPGVPSRRRARGRRRDGQQGARDLDRAAVRARVSPVLQRRSALCFPPATRGGASTTTPYGRRIRREADVCADGRQASS